MSPEAQSLLKEWSPPIALNMAILLVAGFYVRGWFALRRTSAGLISAWRLTAFLAGVFFLWFAIGSPLSAFDEASLTVHMVQHILLMLVAPPLILLGAPNLPLLHGLPERFVRSALGPLLRLSSIQALGKFLAHPLVCWILAAVVLIAWHVPSAFELALGSEFWHDLEHMCFLSTSLLFWWPVVEPFPSEAHWPRWTIPLYLFLGMFPSGALGAFLAFCDRVLYPSYLKSPQVFQITPLADQILAGTLMWVLGIFVCIVPAVFITLKLLSPRVKVPEASLGNASRI
ncbi:MAG TPA: cytochrome c oxidase assembly protein [Candidatus Acidoferrum sp.]|nr:cytochrome c oxidase assembly protein [Candidatus Acidoferrum sp.]